MPVFQVCLSHGLDRMVNAIFHLALLNDSALPKENHLFHLFQSLIRGHRRIGSPQKLESVHQDREQILAN